MRKPIQIAVTAETESAFGSIFALCDDGSIWYKDDSFSTKWVKVDDIPQDDEQENPE